MWCLNRVNTQALITISMFGLFTLAIQSRAHPNFLLAKPISGSINYDFIWVAETVAHCAVLCFIHNPKCISSYFEGDAKLCYILLFSSQGQTGQFLIPNDTNMISTMPFAKDCAVLYEGGFTESGVYTIYPEGVSINALRVDCDMLTDGGGWTVFQTRKDGSEDFFRDWDNYKKGFGNLTGEFWMGNDNLHRLTSQRVYQLRIDLEDATDDQRYALYEDFFVASEDDGYKLSFGNYSGNAGDSLAFHRGSLFTTKDRDNDDVPGENCALTYYGGWWYHHCQLVNLNGLHRPGPIAWGNANGLNWYGWHGYSYSMRRTSMKFRPVDFKSG